MERQGVFSFCLVAFALCIATLPAGTWADLAAKPVYARALGPPAISGMSSITVPYMPKASPFFPKFVDPKTMITKKTSMLSNLFGGLGPAAYGPGAYGAGAYGAGAYGDTKPLNPYGADVPFYNPYASLKREIEPKKAEIVQEPVQSQKPTESKEKRGMMGPFGGMGPGGPAANPMASSFASLSPKFGPMGPKFGPMGPKFGSMFANPAYPSYGPYSEYSRRKRDAEPVAATGLEFMAAGDKPTSKNLGPPPPYPGLHPIPEEPEGENVVEKATGTPKEYLPGMFGPFGFGGPFGPYGPFGAYGGVGPAVDPSMFISKKSTFLDTLFKNLATSTPSPTDVTDTPTPKSTIVPPSFWIPTGLFGEAK